MIIKKFLSGVIYVMVSCGYLAAQEINLSKEGDEQRQERLYAMSVFRNEAEKQHGDTALSNIRFGISATEYLEKLPDIYRLFKKKDSKVYIEENGLLEITEIYQYEYTDTFEIAQMGEDGNMKIVGTFEEKRDDAHDMVLGEERTMRLLDERRPGASFRNDSLYNITFAIDCGMLYCKDLQENKTYEEKFGAFNRNVNKTILSLYSFIKDKYGEADDNVYTKEPFAYRTWKIQDNTGRGPDQDHMYCYIEWDMGRRNIQIIIRDRRCLLGMENCTEGCDWYSSVKIYLSLTDKHILKPIPFNRGWN